MTQKQSSKGVYTTPRTEICVLAWRSYDVISFWRDVIPDVFQKTYFYWTDSRKYDVKNWWRHNSVKSVIIGLIIFLWTFIIKINNRGHFYVNLFNRSMFSKKRQIWRYVKYNVVITASNMSLSIWYWLHTYFASNYTILTIFTAFGSLKVLFL